MSRSFSDIHEMQLVYDTAKQVYDGDISVEAAAKLLEKQVKATVNSIKMYFNIYACMRRGACYKMGTSASFTRFLLDNIYKDFGREAYVSAITSVKGNAAYRRSKDNGQPGLEIACIESIESVCPVLDFESIPTASFEISSPKPTKKKTTKTKPVNASKEKGGKGAVGHKAPQNKALDTIPQDTMDGKVIRKESSKAAMTLRKKATSSSDSNLEVFELNIQPAASILNVFSRLSYKPWYAIGEFVDNSTQSYLSHVKELSKDPNFTKLVVEVDYDPVKNQLTIFDNAFGMEIDRFQDAVRLDARNEHQTGRNEFGMGLKTAASWFGNVWKVVSTQYKSHNIYTAVVDIPQLKESGDNCIEIKRTKVDPNLHGTWIFIQDVTKKITGPRTIGKIRTLLSSMYRRDINQNNIEIRFNGEPIVFEEYPILQNYRGKTWKKDLDFDVLFESKKFHVTGFVAIMNPGSFPKAGFALFRQNRVVVGGLDQNYKPSAIFGQAQSQRSLKLFGELNMNDFPVNQAKDGFIWDDGLEDAFIDTLKLNIQEYIDIADISIKEREAEEQLSDAASDRLHEDVTNAINNAFNNGDSEDSEPFNDVEVPDTPKQDFPQNSDIQEYIDTVLHAEVLEETISTKREYKVQLGPADSVVLCVQWARGNNSYWIEYSANDECNYDITINIDHPFFMPFAKEEGFHKVLEKFTVAFVLAEIRAKMISGKSGYIRVSDMKNAMNKYLDKLSED